MIKPTKEGCICIPKKYEMSCLYFPFIRFYISIGSTGYIIIFFVEKKKQTTYRSLP